MSKLTPGKEYERKFLVLERRFAASAAKREATRQDIRQGYLALAPAQVRVRSTGGSHVLEIKGDDDLELEAKPLTREEGALLLRDYAPRVASIIEKTRYEIPAGFDGLSWEVDVFKGANAPLVIAEIEMPSKGYALDAYEWPDWIGPEVTADPRFKNKNLAVKAFTRWPKPEQKKTLKRMGL
ncbi:MAG TPA: CYTH domain-containing protein [Patescibacteria group bacterium]|nr:CYTH domain-containing protein [Patescibacteria group bacterium]